jgi:hypothetical protein
MIVMIFLGLVSFAFANIALASDCGGGSYKDDDWTDEKSEVSMSWADTPDFNCFDGIESVSFSIKAGQYEGPANACYGAEWDQNGWKVWENWTSEEEKNEKGCQDISHVIVEWKCACAIPTPTPTLPVEGTPTTTATLPVEVTATATLPVEETSTATLPVVDKTPTPTITKTPHRVNTGTVMPTAGAGGGGGAGGPTTPPTPIRWNWLILSLIGATGLGGSFIPLKRQDA